MTMNGDRRALMQRSAAVAGLLCAAGLLPRAAWAAWPQNAFEAKSVADALKALGAAAPAESKDVTLTVPEIAENGAVVPVGCATTLGGCRRMALLVDKNPNALSAIFEVSDAVDANFSVRVKMGETSNVTAVAFMGDGRVLFARREVKVTLGGCGG